MLPIDDARAAAERLVKGAIRAGADAADSLYAGNRSTSVAVRLRELEHVSQSESEEIGLRVFVGARSATVSSSDLSAETVDELIQRALAMAAEAPEDRFAGLAPPELMATPPFPELDSVDSDEPELEVLRQRALDAEAAALAVDGVTNSSGGSAGASGSTVALATSAGFAGARSATGFSCSVGVIAGEGGTMQRDHAWHSARHYSDLDTAEEIGRLAGERAVARLNPTRPRSGAMPVL
ncbi:MAG TPA: DNA gyrase modulator, partial [Sphingomicrobium sp.]|nr:DNA gyrase modulator [Sphingomicrobium sp.]